MDVVNRLGNDAYGSYLDIKEIIKTIEQGQLEDPTIEKKVKAMRKKLIYSMIRQLEIQYLDIRRSNDPCDHNAKETWLVLMKKLIPTYSENEFEYFSYSEDFEAPPKEKIVKAVDEFVTKMNSYYPEEKESYINWKKKTMEIINFSFTA